MMVQRHPPLIEVRSRMRCQHLRIPHSQIMHEHSPHSPQFCTVMAGPLQIICEAWNKILCRVTSKRRPMQGLGLFHFQEGSLFQLRRVRCASPLHYGIKKICSTNARMNLTSHARPPKTKKCLGVSSWNAASWTFRIGMARPNRCQLATCQSFPCPMSKCTTIAVRQVQEPALNQIRLTRLTLVLWPVLAHRRRMTPAIERLIRPPAPL
jgi:hypothetical protein